MAEEVIIKIATDADLSDAETLEDLIEKIRNEASDIPLDFDETPAEEDVDGLTEKLDALSTVAVGQVLSQYGSEAENMAQQMNNAAISVGQLSTNVGVAEPQMVSLINHISNATFPQEEAMAYVGALNQMGVSANQLGDSATNMDRINDATGIGYQKVMQLTQGLQAVGVSANNLPSSFNAIAYAQANVNGGADTLSMVLKRQAATINEYGLNVDQLVLIMQKLSEQGVQGMKMGSELSKVLKETNGDTRALEQSLGLQAGALSNASSVTGQYEGKLQELANEEAEHKTILDQLNAAWEDFSLSMSPIIAPLSSIMGMIGQAGSWAVGVNGLIQLANTMRGLELATLAKAAADKIAAAAQWLLNIAMDANPIVLVVLALVALAAALIWAYQNVDWFREMVNNLWAGLQQLASMIWDNLCGALQWLGQIFAGTGQIMQDTITNAVNWIISALQGLWTYIITLGGLLPENVSITGNQIIDTILRVVMFLLTLPMQIGMIFTNIIAKTLGFGDNFVQNMIRAGSESVSNFMSWISSLPGKLAAELNNMLSAVNEWAATLPQKFWEAGVNAVKNFLSALGIASPGTMQRMLTWEITEMGKNVPDDSRKLVNNIGEMGENIVDAFGNPSLSLNDIGNGNGNLNDSLSNLNVLQGGISRDIIVNVYGDIDNDKRIRELVEAVRKELSWNNKTAGRTV